MRTSLVLAAALLWAAPSLPAQVSPSAPAAPDAAEQKALDAAGRPGLLDLRAASASFADAVTEGDRAALAADERAHAELAEMRAMELSDHDLMIILGTAAIVVLLALIF